MVSERLASDVNIDDVLLWALAQHCDVTVDMIRTRWGGNRATWFRYRDRCNTFRAKFAAMPRSRQPNIVCGRSAVVNEGGSTTNDAAIPGFVGTPIR